MDFIESHAIFLKSQTKILTCAGKNIFFFLSRFCPLTFDTSHLEDKERLTYWKSSNCDVNNMFGFSTQ